MNDPTHRHAASEPTAGSSRRRFLGAAVGLVGAAAVAVPVLASGTASAAPEPSAAGIDPYNGEPLDASVDCELTGRDA